jgi:hypothetical protein
MKSIEKIVATLLLVLLCATVYGLFRTGRQPDAKQELKNPAGRQTLVVDQASLLTARRLAATPTTEQELPLAQEALRLGDKEMDLAFAAAIREVTDHPPTMPNRIYCARAAIRKAKSKQWLRNTKRRPKFPIIRTYL